MSEEEKHKSANVIDFSHERQTPRIKQYSNHCCLGDVTICRCTLAPNPGMVLSVRQLVVGIYSGTPLALTSREGDVDRVRTIKSSHAVIIAPQTRLYLEWGDTSPRFTIVAIEKVAVERILSEANGNPNIRLQSTFGAQDKVVRQLVQACQDEISDCGECGRLFTDSLAAAIVTHVYRTYANATFPKITKGGLTPRDAKRVLTYIEEHLHTDIGLDELALSVSLSAHYFTEAFKKSLGMPPYRYLLHRRVERAKEMLLTADMPPAKIAEEVGFSSQSQLTTNFRKIVGTTPARFRRDAR